MLGNDCAAFVAQGEAYCMNAAFKGQNSAGMEVTAYEACAVSCPLDNAAATEAGIPERTCSAPDAPGVCAE